MEFTSKSKPMKNKLLSCALSILLLLGMLAPAISEICCSESCSGGTCDIAEAEVVCDLDASAACCPEESAAPSKTQARTAAVVLIDSECLPCPCFNDDETHGFIVPQKSRGSAAEQTSAVCSELLADLTPTANERALRHWPEGSPAHGPPVFLLGHSLLI